MKAKVLALGVVVIVVGIGFTLWAWNRANEPRPGATPGEYLEEHENYLNMTYYGYVTDIAGAVISVYGFVSRRRKPDTKLSTVVHQGPTSRAGYCPHCGKPLVPDEPYCPGCGRSTQI